MRCNWRLNIVGNSYPNHNIGSFLRSKRISKGWSLFALAHELNLEVYIVEAIELEEWHRLPIGKEQYYVALIAKFLDVDINIFASSWDQLLETEKETIDPYKESLEKVLVTTIMICSIVLLFWFVIPGPNLKRASGKISDSLEIDIKSSHYNIKDHCKNALYPVIGEITNVSHDNGDVLVVLRAIDNCEVIVKNKTGTEQKYQLAASKTLNLRFQEAFTITLNNANAIILEVAGHRIYHSNINKPWIGEFNKFGQYMVNT